MNILEKLPLIFWSIIIIILLYLTIRRYQIKKTENFEDREN